MTIFEEAVCFATEAHQGMRRKSEPKPYIIHPLEVAVIAATMTDDEEILAAAVLHDTVEDTGTMISDIKNKFGQRVAKLVWSETEDKIDYLPAEATWMMRKEESLKVLKDTDDKAVKMVWLSDKLANMRSFYRQWRVVGNDLWNDFNQKDPKMQAWYYRTLTAYLADLKEFDAWQELNQLVNTVFEEAD